MVMYLSEHFFTTHPDNFFIFDFIFPFLDYYYKTLRQFSFCFCFCSRTGPFWICVTLVFSVAISGNISKFLSKMGDTDYHYRPEFHRGERTVEMGI